MSKWFSTTKVIASVFVGMILLGTVLLMLPISTRNGVSTSFIDSLFTATSATCVTGLVSFNTYAYWSLFGQIVIIVLIQIGGIGFMTFAILLAKMLQKRISLSQRVLMQESVSAPTFDGIISIAKMIIKGTAIFELCGAIGYCFFYIPRAGILRGIYFSVFTSISAFCNAGFDLMGYFNQNSLIGVQSNILFMIITMLLIILGGLGFFVWHDLYNKKFKFKKMSLHTKVVLVTSGALILLGTVLILFLEYSNTTLDGLSVGNKILVSLFQSVTTRTAGFQSVDCGMLRPCTVLVFAVLMLIGGSPGSTAGGMKTTTIALLFLNVISTFRKKKSIEVFGRRIENELLRTVSLVFFVYITITIIATVIISFIENLPLSNILFETTSALGTVGLTTGITPTLSTASKGILALLMYFGRIGPLTILLAFTPKRINRVSSLPREDIKIG